MFRKLEIGVSRDAVSVPEIGVGMAVSEFIHSRSVQAQLGKYAARRRVWVHLCRGVCQSHKVSAFGISLVYWEPDPLLYFPVLDALDRAGIRVANVTLSGHRPYRAVIYGLWMIALMVVLLASILTIWLSQKQGLERTIADQQAFKISQNQDNKRYVQQINDTVWERCFGVIQGVRAVQGMMVLAEIESNRTQVQFVVSDQQVDAAVAWAKTFANDVVVDSITEGWVMVHAQ